MTELIKYLPTLAWVVPLLVAGFLWKQVFWLFGVIIIPDDSIGMVSKKFVLFGSSKELPANRIIALNGEAGYQADTLAPGLHIGLWPWQFDVTLTPFFEVPSGCIGVVEACDGSAMPAGRVIAKEVLCSDFQNARAFLEAGGERGPQMSMLPPGKWRINTLLFKLQAVRMTNVSEGTIGVITAKDGTPLSNGRIIAKHVDCDSFQDAKAFMAAGGERGPQSTIVPQGTYRINPYLFDIELVEVTNIPDSQVGVVTTKEGKPLATGEIAGAEIAGHSGFQNPQAFINANGSKGLQEQVLQAGRYFINPHFATVALVPMTSVPIAHVGVVVSYVGAEGTDVTGASFKNGNLVSKGQKGVWSEPLDPGKYAINPLTHSVKMVPTANVVLNWSDGKSEEHKLDAHLSTIHVRSSDGFPFSLNVSQIIHIPRNDASKVIARFGSTEALVSQVLEPMIGNYFRNAAQNSDVIDFLVKRTERQAEAKLAISTALSEYDVAAVETLIGEIAPPEDLMKTLTDRKLAGQEAVTYETQRTAQGVRQSLLQATALANTQAQVVDAERQVAIADFVAAAAVSKAKGDAEAKTINAKADAEVVKVVGEAEAGKVLAIGQAEATVIKDKIASMDSGNYAMVQVAEALSKSGSALVPTIVAGAGGANGNGGLVDVLLGNMLLEHSGKTTKNKGDNYPVAKLDPSEVKPV
jgi:uncharacterized membrane protein YqiK